MECIGCYGSNHTHEPTVLLQSNDLWKDLQMKVKDMNVEQHLSVGCQVLSCPKMSSVKLFVKIFTESTFPPLNVS